MTESSDERAGLPSASNWRRYELCAGSWTLEQKARQLGQLAHETSPQAERGTLIHAYLAGEADEDGSEIKLNEDEQRTADFLQERAQGEVQRVFGEEANQAVQLCEKRLWLTVGGKKVASGKFDRVVYNNKLALVQDFKTGFSPVEDIELNAQLRFLAVVIGLHLPNSVEEIVCQLVSGPFGIFEKRFTRAALAAAWDDVMVTLRKINDPYAPLTPSPEACRYCPAINICQAVKSLVPSMKEVQALPDGLRASELLDSVEVLQKRLDAIREYYAARLSADPAYDLPGYAMVPGAVRREVTDWAAARQRLGEWLELEEINGAANYRLGDLEKALGRKLKLKGKELKAGMNTILEGLIEEKPNAASLKRVRGEPKLAALNC
jgi:hypothetical protein